MQKAILVKDLDTGAESWESFDDFQRKNGGKHGYKKDVDKLQDAVNALPVDATLKSFLLDLVKFMGKS